MTTSEVVKVVATASSLVINLGNDRQITFQSGFEGDEPDEAIFARYDRQMRIADHYKALYLIPELENDLALQTETLANLLVDRQRIDERHEIDQARRHVEIEEMERLCEQAVNEHILTLDGQILDMQNQKKEWFNEGQDAYQRSGKLGGYKPQGHTKVNLERVDKAIESAGKAKELGIDRIRAEHAQAVERVRAEIQKAEAEREFSNRNTAISIERFERAIVDCEAKLAKARTDSGG